MKLELSTGKSRTLLFSLTLAIVAIAGDSNRCALAQGPLPTSSEGVALSNTVPYKLKNVTVEQKLGGQIPLNLPMKDSKGRPVKTGYYFDGKRPTIVTLNYSDCPMLCSVQLDNLAISLHKLELKAGEDFQMLSVSIDPRETPDKALKTKKKYTDLLRKDQPGIDDAWEFCTAKQPIITKLTDSLGFRYRYDRQSGEYYHPAMLAFVSPEGVITRYSLAVDFPPEQMRKALVEAGDGNVGTAVDQFILWCSTFDESTNSYSLVAWKLMRLGGAATIGIVLACLVPYWIGRKGAPGSNQLAEDAVGDDPGENSPEATSSPGVA